MKTLRKLMTCGLVLGMSAYFVEWLSASAPDPEWRPPLEVEHDAPPHVRVHVGDSLVIHLALRNVSDKPITIGYGSRVFVIQGAVARPNTASVGTNIELPAHQSWGSVPRMEFPNPGAAYTLIGHRRTILPGESFTPVLVYGRDAYHVPFDSVGTYSLTICAVLSTVRLCNTRRPSYVEVY